MTGLQKGILKLCIDKGACSIADLSKALDISIPTTTKLLAELVESGFIAEMGKVGTSGGRRPNTFGLNPDAGYSWVWMWHVSTSTWRFPTSKAT